MGLALAQFLAEHQRPVRVTGPFPRDLERLAASRATPRLHDFTLPESVDVQVDPAAALRGAAIIVNAIPSQFIRAVFERMGAAVTTRIYPGMGHLVNEDEAAFARALLEQLTA